MPSTTLSVSTVRGRIVDNESTRTQQFFIGSGNDGLGTTMLLEQKLAGGPFAWTSSPQSEPLSSSKGLAATFEVVTKSSLPISTFTRHIESLELPTAAEYADIYSETQTDNIQLSHVKYTLDSLAEKRYITEDDADNGKQKAAAGLRSGL